MSSATRATWLLSIACSEMPVLRRDGVHRGQCPALLRARGSKESAASPSGGGGVRAQRRRERSSERAARRVAPAAVEVGLRDEVLHAIEDLLEERSLEEACFEHRAVCVWGEGY